MRIPKDGFFAHKVMWDGWVDAKKEGIYIIGHWNYQNGTKKDINVVAAGDKVELILNNKSLGFGKKSDGFLFTFKHIAYQPGTLKAVSYTAAGKKLAETQLKTAGKPVAIKLTAIKNPAGFKADGADVALVQIEVVDVNGNRCPTALNTINFELSGPAEWRGGLAQGHDNFILSKVLPVEGGVNRVLIRSLTQAGKISLSASADGLKPATVGLETINLPVDNGLATSFPADGLKPNLSKGETPKGSSFTVQRKTIKIIAAEAGANNDKAKLSYDDNELSDWVNDGKINTAWIKYTLEKASTVSQVALKLNGFRSKTYPLRISVDGKEVFNGESKTSLGYFTATCKPTKGKTVTIQLLGSGKEKENAAIGVEVNGKKLDDGVNRAETKLKGGLSIIEAEVYEQP
ncbi:hypothetical protein D3C85_717620 [compost metagenome]